MRSFHHAIRTKDETLLKNCFLDFKKENSLVTKLNEPEAISGLTPLQLAICLGNFKFAIKFLIMGADPNIRIFNSRSFPSLTELMLSRNCGKVFFDLIHFANGTFDNSENIAVFHVLFYQALSNHLYEYAIKLLDHILNSQSEELKDAIKNSISGALIYCYSEIIQMGTDNTHKVSLLHQIKNKIETLTKNKDSAKTLIAWRKKLSDPVSNLEEDLNEYNYISIATQTKDILLKNILLEESTLPWILYYDPKNFHSYVNHLLKTESQLELLNQVNDMGYSLNHHKYQLISLDEHADIIKVTPKNKNEIKNLLILSALDMLKINWDVLNAVINCHSESKEENSKSNLQSLMSDLTEHHAQAPHAMNFVRNFLQAEIDIENTSTSQLAALPTPVIRLVTKYLDTKSIYSGLATASKQFGHLARTQQLAYPPTSWHAAIHLKEKLQTIDELITQIQPYEQIGWRTLIHRESVGISAGLLCCETPWIPLLILACQCCSAESVPIALNALGGCCACMGCLSVTVCIGNAFSPYRLNYFNYLNAEVRHSVEQALTLISVDEKPDNTRSLLEALHVERQQIQNQFSLLTTLKPMALPSPKQSPKTESKNTEQKRSTAKYEKLVEEEVESKGEPQFKSGLGL